MALKKKYSSIAVVFPNVSDTSFNFIVSTINPSEHWDLSWYANEDEENGQGESLYNPDKLVLRFHDNKRKSPARMQYENENFLLQWVGDLQTAESATSARINGKMLVVCKSGEQGDAQDLISRMPYHNFGYYPEGHQYDAMGELRFF
jgi:hypothetical protein